MVDYVLLASAGVIAFTTVVLVFFLSRYRSLVNEANESTRMAKDVWDSMSSRFTMMDTRIIELMVQTEVLSAKSVSERSESPVTVPPATPPRMNIDVKLRPRDMAPVTSMTPDASSEGTETETRVLQILLDGPKTSVEIKENLGRSREHTSRLMKLLFDKGLVVRNSRNKPYVYELTDRGRSYLGSWSTGK